MAGNSTTVGSVCAGCAEAAGGIWPPRHAATMSMSECDVCHEIKAVCSPGDWDWPKGRPRRWIGGRD